MSDHTGQSSDGKHLLPQYQGDGTSTNYAVAGYGAVDPVTGVSSWFHFTDQAYLKGFVVGAGVALVVSNPAVQRTLMKGAVKVWTSLQYGAGEVKEQISDIRAEMSRKKEAKEET